MKRSISFLIFYVFVFNASAQEMWGISNSNYSGNMGIFLNPSTIVGAPYKYEFNFLAVDIFAEDTYIYIPYRANLFIRGATGRLDNEKNFFDIYNSNLQSGFAHVTVIGPSFIRNYGNEAWGIHTAYRNDLSAKDVPPGLAKFIYEKYQYIPFYNQRFVSTAPFSVAWLSWGELGGTYGRALIERQNDFLKVAATVNLLAGFDGMYLDGKKLDYTVLDSATVVVHNMDVTMGHALQEDGKTGVGNFLKLRGYGLSTTLGATYIHHRNRNAFDCNNTSDRFAKYQYRLGASLMDFGFIHFTKQAQVIDVNTTTDKTWSGLDTIKFSSVGHLDTLLSYYVNHEAYSAKDKAFTMYLPTAFSLQFDYCFAPMFYGNISWVNRIYYSSKEVAKGNQLDLSGRYERKKFEAAIDFSFFQYSQPSAGVAVRWGIFVLGTDRLLELLSLYDVKSFNLFFGFKLNLCDLERKAKYNCPAYK